MKQNQNAGHASNPTTVTRNPTPHHPQEMDKSNHDHKAHPPQFFAIAMSDHYAMSPPTSIV